MTLLNRSTCRRLKNLRQYPCVWEGDRYPLRSNSGNHQMADGQGEQATGDCVLWVDGSAGTVRAMEMISPDIGQEAVVRVLLRAMEHPNGQMEPGRPQRIVVRNRELQFFLRGVLQDLDIEVNYSEELPFIDEIFRGLQSFLSGSQPRLPQQFADELNHIALDIWRDAPWEQLDEEKILEIQLQDQDVEPLYLSFLGMLGVEFGVLMYRSKESLKSFRQKVLSLDESSQELLEEAFLQQDCLFLTFEPSPPGSPVQTIDSLAGGKSTGEVPPLPMPVQPEFGNLHPLEGMRPNLYEEEAMVVLASLQALHLFLQEHGSEFAPNHFPKVSGEYVVHSPNPSESLATSDAITVSIATLPEFAEELGAMVDASLTEENGDIFPNFYLPVINSETVPSGTLSQVGRIPWDTLEALRTSTKFYQSSSITISQDADGFPIILLQTSRPKALRLIETIEEAGGLQAIGFIPGQDQWGGLSYDLGVLQTRDNTLHVFTEYDIENAIHQKAKAKWNDRCQKSGGYCGLIIAKGVTGVAKGNPGLKDMVALFEVRSLPPEDDGLGMLRLLPQMGSD